MAKYKKKPVLPIYTIAIVWVIYTLVHPLYQVSDYVSVILISVVVFIVAKGVFPTIEDGPAIPRSWSNTPTSRLRPSRRRRRPRRHPPQRTKRRKRRPRQLRPLPRSRRRRKRKTPGADQALLGGFP